MAYGDRGVGVAAGLLAALLVGAGIVAAGWFVGEGFRAGRADQPSVTVKGLAEREVQADLALWPIKFQATGNDLALIQEELDADLATISAFLTAAGFAAEEVQTQGLQVNDYGMGYGGDRPAERYAVIQSVLIRSADVQRVAEVSRRLGELLRQGIVLQQDWQAMGPTYLFTQLNAIKSRWRRARRPASSLTIRARRWAASRRRTRACSKSCRAISCPPPPRPNRYSRSCGWSPPSPIRWTTRASTPRFTGTGH
jgi:hypothetical protein